MNVDVFSRRPHITFILSWNECPVENKSHAASTVACTEIIRNNRFNGQAFDLKSSE